MCFFSFFVFFCKNKFVYGYGFVALIDIVRGVGLVCFRDPEGYDKGIGW